MENYQRDFLSTVYKTCIENMNELPKRRDSMITIYLVVYAAFIGFSTSTKEYSELLLIGLLSVMSIFGFMCSLTIINFRS